jgi:anhydro-N-acetylmuramic acid kinase
MNTKTYNCIGLMSGSSLDGLDIAFCRFEWDGKSIVEKKIQEAETIPFSEVWKTRLKNLPEQNALVFAKTDVYFGYYMGDLVNNFIKKHQIESLDFIASHGHTIFHDPSRRYSIQIGNGAALAATTEKIVINEFRLQDVAHNGEGAPLAPLADFYLFPGFDFYMNIGGIANISANIADKWLAFDIAPANQIFNFLAQKLDLEFDSDGKIAESGTVNIELLEKLQNFDFYQNSYPKSLANEWIGENVLPLFSNDLSVKDQMATSVELLVQETKNAIERILKNENFKKSDFKLLVSGGGAYNKFMIQSLVKELNKINISISIPEDTTIQFKEAQLIALLGLLRLEEIPNSFPSVTGARKATINGAVHLG